MIEITKRTSEIVAKLTMSESNKRLESAVFDLIAVRLADKYIQEQSDFLLHDIIDVNTLKEEVVSIIKKRLIDETETKIQKL